MGNGGLRVSSVLRLLIIFTLSIVGCSSWGDEDPGPVRTDEETVELGDASSVAVEIAVKTAAGVTITDGGNALLNGDFIYNERLEPEISYSVEDDRGTLDIVQPRIRDVDRNKLKNEWDLQLGSDVPMDIGIDMSSSDTELEISSLALATLEVDTSSGNLRASIGGRQGKLDRIDANSSSGDINVDLEGIFTHLETIEVDQSSGDVELSLIGEFRALDSISIDSSSGNTTVEVAGVWSVNLDAIIDTSSGNVTLIVPTDIGVRISVNVSSGNINADGFRIDGGAYVNDVYGETEVTLRFDIDVSSGNVNLELSE